MCNYCLGEGHRKDKCLLLKLRVKPHSPLCRLPLYAPVMLCSFGAQAVVVALAWFPKLLFVVSHSLAMLLCPWLIVRSMY